MRQINLPACGFSVSRFAFGCARLFNAGPAHARANLLARAADCGFSHFDVAPSYGFGMAERAPLLQSRPELTVATKVGLYAPGREDGNDAKVFLRKAAGLLWPPLSKARVDFSLARARSSLEGSLRRLRRGHVDLFLLHAPRIDLIATDEWLSWLEQLVIAGKTRAFGLAATSVEAVEAFLDRCPALAPVIQCPDSLDRREADPLFARNRPPQFSYGYLAAARQRQPQRAEHGFLPHIPPGRDRLSRDFLLFRHVRAGRRRLSGHLNQTLAFVLLGLALACAAQARTRATANRTGMAIDATGSGATED